MQYQPPEDLKRFLAAGSRPVYVGFGSMTLSKAKVPCRDCLGGIAGHSNDELQRLHPCIDSASCAAQCAARAHASKCKKTSCGLVFKGVQSACWVWHAGGDRDQCCMLYNKQTFAPSS